LWVKVASKDLSKTWETLDKLRDSNVTLVLTVDLSKAPKDVVNGRRDRFVRYRLGEGRFGSNGRELKVRKINGSASKIE